MTQTDPAQMVVQQDAGVTSNIQSVGNGWYRVSMTFTMLSAGTLWYLIVSSNTNSYPVSYAGTGKSVYVWGAQLNLGSTAMSYQRIAAAPTLSQPPTYATTSTMGGEVFRPYLDFDGGDGFITASVSFTSTDKATVCCGATKLSDAAYGAILDLSADPASNAGSFAIGASALIGGDRQTWSYQGVGTVNDFGVARPFAAPNTAVQTLQLDIAQATSATEIVGRRNGVAQTLQFLNGTNIGTGNLGNYPMYIGRRNNSTAPFTGYIYSLIVRGVASSASEVGTLESYVASKTGVTL
jgi:hypothetical protein